jgi:trehalose/maltose hydrolase-like predicted phosphorylase
MFADGSRKGPDSEIVPFPSPFQFRMRGAEGELFSSDPIGSKESKKASRRLDLKRGLYSEVHFFEDSDGRRTRVRSLRFVSLADPHLIAKQIHVETENYSGSHELDFSSQFTEQVSLYPHLELINQVETEKDCELLHCRTKGSGTSCAVVSRCCLDAKKLGLHTYVWI